MKVFSDPLNTLLDSGRFVMADLFAFGLISGINLRYTNFDRDIISGGYPYSSSGLLIKRSALHWKNDLSVDTLDLEISPQGSALISGTPFLTAVRQGIFDGAAFILGRAFFSAPVGITDAPVEAPALFYGRVGDFEADRTKADMVINSHLELLNIPCPREIYESGCPNLLYGPIICRATPVTSGTATVSVVNAENSFDSDINDTNRIYTGGYLEWTYGANLGLKGKIKSSIAYTMIFAGIWPSAVTVGDTFIATAGCDKTSQTCQAIFSNNVANFRGFPYIPRAESAQSV
jgi:uncharacterized phage protein (TIGR02218 family)